MALSREHGIIIGVVVLGGLSFLVWKQAKHDQELGSSTKVDLPDVKGTDDLDKIEITNGDKGTVTLEKQGDKWQVTQPAPVKGLASSNNVKMLLDNLKELKATEMVASKADDAIKASYNLDAPHALHLVGYKGADKKVDDWFGKSGGRGEMMMVNGNPDIVAASGYSSFLYTREAKDWRDHDLIKYDAANVSSITIDNKSGKIVCTKTGDKWGCTDDGKAIPNFDETKGGDLSRAFQYLIAADFPPPEKTPADTGLDKPASTVTIATKDATYTLKVGAESSGGNHYAMRNDDPLIYIINANASDWALAKADKLEKAADAGAAAPKSTDSKTAKK